MGSITKLNAYICVKGEYSNTLVLIVSNPKLLDDVRVIDLVGSMQDDVN